MTMSLFGGSFEPADVPDSSSCPDCGTPSVGRCARCRAAGHEAPTLGLSTLTTCNACDVAPMAPGQDAPGEPGYCAGCLREARPLPSGPWEGWDRR